LFENAVKLGRKRYEARERLSVGEHVADAILERLVRDKVRRRFGGRLKALVSGGAPLNPDIGLFFTALGLNILQGYGQTEAAPVISVNRPNRVKIHTVGPAVIDTDVRIADDGEILVRGELVMQGYWRNSEATAEVIRDGWLHTGDVGRVDEDGYIEITDRKKDIIVNSGGDNVSPQRIEGILTLAPEIAQAMVFGDSRPHLVALLVPDEEWSSAWAIEHGKGPELAALSEDHELHAALAAIVDSVNGQLSMIEKVRHFLIARAPFTIDNEQLTPTLKVRRHKIVEIYGDALDALYH
jgi:long-chain acyl-CoA synthetase